MERNKDPRFYDNNTENESTNDGFAQEPKEMSIIDRNKKLAKCGQGILSLTTMESLRLAELLEEVMCDSEDQPNFESDEVMFPGRVEALARLQDIDILLQIYEPDNKLAEIKQRKIDKRATLKKLNKRLLLLQSNDAIAMGQI